MYHVNPNTGEIGRCYARSPHSCPFGVLNHSYDYEKLQIIADGINKGKISNEVKEIKVKEVSLSKFRKMIEDMSIIRDIKILDDFVGITSLDVIDVKFENVTFPRFSYINFNDCNFENCNFKLEDCHDLNKIVFHNEFNYCKISNCDFSGIKFNDIIFDNTEIKNSNFANTEFYCGGVFETNFTDCNFSDSKTEFMGWFITSLNKCNAKNVSFTNTDLNSFTVKDSNFENFNITTKSVFVEFEDGRLGVPVLEDKYKHYLDNDYKVIVRDCNFTNTNMNSSLFDNVDIENLEINNEENGKYNFNKCNIKDSYIKNMKEGSILFSNINSSGFHGLGEINFIRNKVDGVYAKDQEIELIKTL